MHYLSKSAGIVIPRASAVSLLYEKSHLSRYWIGMFLGFFPLITSLGFHKSLGFTEVGHFHNAGIKKGQWLGIVWMNKFIGIDGADAKEPIWYENYKDE